LTERSKIRAGYSGSVSPDPAIALGKSLKLGSPSFIGRTRFCIIEVHLWFERKIPESTDPDIDQTERWMIERDVAAAFRAITPVADVAALELPQELRAFDEVHILPFPQRERADRRSGITSAIFAITVSHL
jgi:hypothetical protein